MLSNCRFAGAGALLLAPLVVIAADLVRPTESDDAANQFAALTNHRGAVIAGIALTMIGVALLTAGIVWLALRLAPHAPRLALAGGVLGVLGLLLVMFESGVNATGPAIVHGLSPAQATATLHNIWSSAGIAALAGPVKILFQIGIALLGIAVVKAGAARWAGAAIVIGAIAEGVGFGTNTKALVIAAFAIMLAGLVEAVRTLVPAPRERLVPQAVTAS